MALLCILLPRAPALHPWQYRMLPVAWQRDSHQQAGKKPQHCRATGPSSYHTTQPPLQTIPAKPLPPMRCSCQAPSVHLGCLFLCVACKAQTAGSWQIIPSSPSWTSQGTTGECHDSFQTLPQRLWKIMARAALIEKTSEKIQLEGLSLLPAP